MSYSKLISLMAGAAAGPGGGYTIIDSDAQAGVTAAGITDDTLKQAADELIIDIKAISSGAVWTALRVIYLFIGGNASAHAVNWKNPGTHNGTMNGTITHDANGVLGNGTTGYINTNFNQSTHGADDDEHLSLYSRTNLGASGSLAGVVDSGSNGTLFNPFTGTNRTTRSQNNASETVAETDSLGYSSLNRTASTGYRFRRNGTNTNITATGNTAPLNLNFYLLCRNNNGTAGNFVARNLAWAAIGRGLSEADDGSLRTAVQDFQTFLGRQV
jgi:hypothetical protein